MKKTMKRCLPLMGILALGGCGDANEPTKANVTEALNEYLEKAPLCLGVVVSPEASLSEIDASYHAMTKAYEPMVAAGLLSVSSHKEVFRDHKTAASSPTEYEHDVYDYKLTDFGKMFYKAQGSLDGGLEGGRLCYATRQVESVDSVSEVTEMQGKKVIHVQFAARLEQYPAWSKDSVIKAFPETHLVTDKAKQGTAVLVLTSKGWKHKDLAPAQ